MANQAFDRTILNPRERPLADDIDQAESQLDRALRESLRLMTSDLAAGTAFLGTSFQVLWAGTGFSVVLQPGVGFQQNTVDVPSAINGVAGLDDLEQSKPLVLSTVQAITIDNAAALATGTGFPLTIDATNNAFGFKPTGLLFTNTISITQGTYATGADLVTAIVAAGSAFLSSGSFSGGRVSLVFAASGTVSWDSWLGLGGAPHSSLLGSIIGFTGNIAVGVGSTITGALTGLGPGQSRIDIIEARYNRRVTNPSSRDVLDANPASPTFLTFIPSTVNKTLSFDLFSLTGRVVSPANSTQPIGYKVGVASTTPAAPAVSPGYTIIAFIRVNAGDTAVVPSQITDTRLIIDFANRRAPNLFTAGVKVTGGGASPPATADVPGIVATGASTDVSPNGGNGVIAFGTGIHSAVEAHASVPTPTTGGVGVHAFSTPDALGTFRRGSIKLEAQGAPVAPGTGDMWVDSADASLHAQTNGIVGQGLPGSSGNGVTGIGGTPNGFGLSGTGTGDAGAGGVGRAGTGAGAHGGIFIASFAVGGPGKGAIQLAPQTAPSAPDDGDVWIETTGDLKFKGAGTVKTVGPVFAAAHVNANGTVTNQNGATTLPTPSHVTNSGAYVFTIVGVSSTSLIHASIVEAPTETPLVFAWATVIFPITPANQFTVFTSFAVQGAGGALTGSGTTDLPFTLTIEKL
jgi:hypothetical protein